MSGISICAAGENLKGFAVVFGAAGEFFFKLTKKHMQNVYIFNAFR